MKNETMIVIRKNEKNVVLLSLEQYNQIMKAAKNSEYLAIISASDDVPGLVLESVFFDALL